MKRWLHYGLVLVLGLGIWTTSLLAAVEPGYGVGLAGTESVGTSRDHLIRFRVIAASDSAGDQQVKLIVRDAVLDYLRPELQSASSKEQAAAVINGKLDAIARVANCTLSQVGSHDRATVSFGVTGFPAKGYGPMIFPAGDYQALKIVIGPGEGKNWWCVLFPPLCYVDLTRGEPGQGEDCYQATRLAVLDLQEYSGENRVAHQLGLQGRVHLTTRIGEWLSGGNGRTILSWLWQKIS